jgi:hypothetical protein
MYRDDRAIGRLIGMSAVAGAVGALVRGLYYMICGAATGVGPWAIPDLAGSMLTGTRTTAFAAGTSLGGLLLHLVTGAIWGVIFGLVVGYLVPRALATRGRAIVTGLIFGVVAYLIDLAVGPAINPLTAQIHPLIGSINAFIGHLIFGVVTAYSLYAYTDRPGLRVMFARDEARVRDRDNVLR